MPRIRGLDRARLESWPFELPTVRAPRRHSDEHDGQAKQMFVHQLRYYNAYRAK